MRATTKTFTKVLKQTLAHVFVTSELYLIAHEVRFGISGKVKNPPRKPPPEKFLGEPCFLGELVKLSGKVGEAVSL